MRLPLFLKKQRVSRERRVLAMRDEGLSYDEIGRRFNRGPDHIRRVERYAGFRTEFA